MAAGRISLFLIAVAAAVAAPHLRPDMQPISEKRCVICHGPAQQMSGLRLDRSEGAPKGGYSGPAIVAGDAWARLLVKMMTTGREGRVMPPAGPSLTPEEIARIRGWIDADASWPAGESDTAASLAAKQTHWAFQLIRRADLPIAVRLRKEGIDPSPEASRATLIRRVSLDLTGLLPGPASPPHRCGGRCRAEDACVDGAFSA